MALQQQRLQTIEHLLILLGWITNPDTTTTFSARFSAEIDANFEEGGEEDARPPPRASVHARVHDVSGSMG